MLLERHLAWPLGLNGAHFDSNRHFGPLAAINTAANGKQHDQHNEDGDNPLQNKKHELFVVLLDHVTGLDVAHAGLVRVGALAQELELLGRQLNGDEVAVLIWPEHAQFKLLRLQGHLIRLPREADYGFALGAAF
jgi:hypothetical protein